MSRPDRRWWALYAGCAALAIGALAVVTVVVLRLERQGQALRMEAERESTIRIALWRMDSWLAPHLAREAARPYFEYAAYYPSGAAYTRLLSPIRPGEVLTPSPLLTFESKYFALHFQLDAQHRLTSPQAPEGNQLDLALATLVTSERVDRARERLERLRALIQPEELIAACSLAEQRGRASGVEMIFEAMEKGSMGLDLKVQAERSWQEAQKRMQQTWENVQIEPMQAADHADEPVLVGPLLPIWLPHAAGDAEVELLFVRRVRVGGQELYQGFACDWPVARSAMLAVSEDLLPGADLVPMLQSAPEAVAHSLATIPAMLVARPITGWPVPLITSSRLALGAAWLAVLSAIVAAGVTLHASIDFGRRRSRFASAVTHELRTPLTTFRIYSEMLADGMVTEPARQHEYHLTLAEQARRLSDLVENVLAYARIEEGRAPLRARDRRLGEVLDEILPPLRERCASTGARLDFDRGALGDLTIRLDVDALGQILFNLVDNACKYACAGDEPIVRLDVRRGGGWLEFAVRDFGPGIDRRCVRRIFEPFDRGRIDESSGIGGVGLGLALARELAASLGGSIELSPGNPGSLFVLKVPLQK